MDGQIQPIEDDGAQQTVTTNQTSTSMNDVQSGVSKDSREKSELAAIVDALNKSQATIEFDLDGKILHANDLFLGAMGYSLNEIKGKHHSMFVEPEYAASNEYRDFWLSLQAGKFQSAQYKRIAKGGREIYIQASYNPIIGTDGRPYKVVKFATDVTEQKLRNADFQGQIDAVNRSQATIEFELDGTIRKANDLFLKTLGYSLDEIKGKHHSMFLDKEESSSVEYQGFWKSLAAGEFKSGEFKRVGKGGKEVYILASYNPIFDLNGKPCKVVKYATDVTFARDQRIEAVKTIHNELIVIGGEVKTVSNLVSETANASELTAANVQAMAAATEEMTASVREISQQVVRSNGVAQHAVTQAQSSNSAMEALSESAQRIGDVVQLISDIASQTNLLALNATIEAARAGDAGKGFAVVASEVKNLATQTAKATADIGAQIAGIQSSATASVDAMKSVTETIGEISEISTSISAAVEEQTTVTEEISQNMQTASAGVDQIASGTAEISAAMQKVDDATARAGDICQSLS